MKKVLIVVIALLLALPALSFAGSATSRWDLTIGGFVKLDAGWANQSPAGYGGTEDWTPVRGSLAGHPQIANQTGSLSSGTGTTNLNFLIKGPDTFGAKTSAYIMGNFMGQGSNAGQTAARYGLFSLGLAYMDFTWATTKLTIGQTFTLWGFQPSYNVLGAFDEGIAFKGGITPQIQVTQNFNKNFYGSFALQEPYNMKDSFGYANNTAQAYGPYPGATAGQESWTAGLGTVNNSTRVTTNLPDFAGEIGFKSDACGVIGPFGLQMAFGGFWGQDNVVYLDPAGATSASNGGTSYGKAHVDRWATTFKWFVPIIPEKNLHKAGALAFSGDLMMGQNNANLALARAAYSEIPYDADPTIGVNYKSPLITTMWGQATYYLTDQLYFNFLYAHFEEHASELFMQRYPDSFRQGTNWIANLMYDVNPAVRMGVEWQYGVGTWNYFGAGGQSGGGNLVSNVIGTSSGGNGFSTANAAASYNGGTPTLMDSKGSYWSGKVAFWYFF